MNQCTCTRKSYEENKQDTKSTNLPPYEYRTTVNYECEIETKHIDINENAMNNQCRVIFKDIVLYLRFRCLHEKTWVEYTFFSHIFHEILHILAS